MITPFCVTQTYEGLLDEFFRIQTCSIQVDLSIIKPESKDGPQGGAPPSLKQAKSVNEEAKAAKF